MCCLLEISITFQLKRDETFTKNKIFIDFSFREFKFCLSCSCASQKFFIIFSSVESVYRCLENFSKRCLGLIQHEMMKNFLSAINITHPYSMKLCGAVNITGKFTIIKCRKSLGILKLTTWKIFFEEKHWSFNESHNKPLNELFKTIYVKKRTEIITLEDFNGHYWENQAIDDICIMPSNLGVCLLRPSAHLFAH